MRLTVRTNLAMRILMHCAIRSPDMLHAAEVARACNASSHHVAQVVSALGDAGFLATTRGRGGGISLAMTTESITVGAIMRLFEAGVPFTECMDDVRNTCPLSMVCRLKTTLCRAIENFYRELDGVTLADLVEGNEALVEVLDGREAMALV